MKNEAKKKTKKRFYKENQVIWSIDLKKEVKVKSVNTKDLVITVLENTVDGTVEHTFPLWSVDTLKYKAKEELVKNKKNKAVKVYMAKINEDAIIPSKIEEDAGYDIYANLQSKDIGGGKSIKELLCPALQTTLVPTGIAMALPNTHYFNAKHERGSTGSIAMSVLSGVVDSGYRGELFIAIAPLHKDILITDEVKEATETQHCIYYPYSKAICQGTIDLVPKVDIEVIPYEELKNIDSIRGEGKLGQSGK